MPVRTEPQAAVVAPSKPVAVLGQAADAMGGAQASESDKLAAQYRRLEYLSRSPLDAVMAMSRDLKEFED